MLCPQCGTSVDKSYKFCPSCGATLPSTEKNSLTPMESNYGEGGVIKKRRMPLWFKILTALAVIALIGVTAGILFTESLVDVIDHQLDSLRHSDIDKAYYQYTSKEFQQATPFKEFQDFIQAYPIFSTNQSAHFTQRALKDDVGTIRGNLTAPDHTKVPVEYKLIKEDGKWKILSLRLLNAESTKNAQEAVDSEELNQVIRQQLQEIKSGQIANAYDKYSSKEFKEATTSEAFQGFIAKYPILNQYDNLSFSPSTTRNGIGIVSASLHKDDITAYIKYYLVYEDHQWKILSMRILSPNEEKGEQATQFSSKTDMTEPLMTNIEDVSVGTEVNANGVIQNPATTFNIRHGAIYANVEVADGAKGDVVYLTFQHLDSHSSILTKAKIEEPGDSMINSVFSPPVEGWPKGQYQLLVSVSGKDQKTVDFSIE